MSKKHHTDASNDYGLDDQPAEKGATPNDLNRAGFKPYLTILREGHVTQLHRPKMEQVRLQRHFHKEFHHG